MGDPLTTRSSWATRGLMPATRVMVRERRRRLCGLAEGRVLDLSGTARPTDFRRADEVVSGADAVRALRAGASDAVFEGAELPPGPGSSDPAGDRPERERAPVGRFDTVVSVLFLSGASDPVDALARLAAVLAADGVVVFLEPVRDPGIGRYGQRIVSPVLQRTAGWRVDRDIPALLRDADWAITDLERIPMPRYLWPLHGLVEGRTHPRGRRAS